MPTASEAAPHQGPTAGIPTATVKPKEPNRSSPLDGLVSRRGLVRSLVTRPDKSLVVVVAPPGYGKSSLLHEWSARDPRLFIWARPDDLRAGVLPKRRPDERGFVLAIDDCQDAAPGDLREFVEASLRELPAGSTLALASRTELDLPLGRLRARRVLLEVGVGELAMVPAQAAVLLRRAGLKLDFDSIQVLAQRTEGWPTGLYLAALSLRAQAADGRHASGFGGDDRLVVEYFRDELLVSTPPDLLSFELQCAVLDELTGAMCDAVLMRRGSDLMLARAARENQFLQPLDPAHERYRFHPLLRETLERELWRRDRELAAELHSRASAWLYEHGEVDRAIAHAIAADDAQRAGELLWTHLVRYLTHGRGADIQGWLNRFGETRVASSRELAVAAGHAALTLGDAEQACQWWLAAAAVTDGREAPDSSPGVEVALAILEAMTARTSLAAMRDAAARAYSMSSETSPWRPLTGLVHGTALYLAGQADAADEVLFESAELAGGLEPSVAALAVAHRSIIAAEQGEWEGAAELAETAVAVLHEHGLAEQPISAIVFAAAAAWQARSGRPDEAKQNVRLAVGLLADLGNFVPWYGALARIMLGHASLWLADVVRARTLLAEASRLARKFPDVAVFAHWFDEAWEHIDTLAETRLAGPSALTIAELRVLRFLPSHRSFKEIGVQLGVSANTVKTQALAVYRKLGVASRSEAVTRAHEAGLLGG